MGLLDQSGVAGGPEPYNVHALFVNMDNMWVERFGNYDRLVRTGYFTNLKSFTWHSIINYGSTLYKVECAPLKF